MLQRRGESWRRLGRQSQREEEVGKQEKPGTKKDLKEELEKVMRKEVLQLGQTRWRWELVLRVLRGLRESQKGLRQGRESLRRFQGRPREVEGILLGLVVFVPR